MNPFSSPIQAALAGAILAFTASLLYGLTFTLLAALRSGLRIRRLGAGTAMLYLANTTAILIASLEFSLLLGLAAAVFQGLAWLLTAALVSILVVDPPVLAIGIALLFAIALHAALYNTRGIPHAILWRSFSSYAFWLGLPSLIFIAMTVWAFA